MRNLNLRRPSPALVISIIALVLAVGGGAFAVAASQKSVAKKVVKKLAPKLTVGNSNHLEKHPASDFLGVNAVGVNHPIAMIPVSKPATGENAKVLFTAGPFTYVGTCDSTGVSRVDASTSEAGSSIHGSDNSGDNLPAGTTITGVTTNGSSPDEGDVSIAAAPSGLSLFSDGPVGWNTTQFNNDPNNCYFGGDWRLLHG